MTSTTPYVTSTQSYQNVNMSNSGNGSNFMTFDPRKEAEYQRLWHLQNYINEVYLWPIVVIGLPSNMVTVATVWIMASGTSAYYLGTLATCDALAIVVKVVYRETSKYVSLSHVGCKLFSYAAVTTTTTANWVLVALAAERYNAVANPLWVSNQRGLRKTLAILAALLVTIGIIYLHLLVTAGTVTDVEALPCGLLPGFPVLRRVWPWVDMLLYGLLPCLTLLLLNVMLLYKLRSSMAAQRRLVTDSQQMTSQRLQRQISAMLLTASSVFVVLVLPLCVFLVLEPFLQLSPGMSFADDAIFNKKKALARERIMSEDVRAVKKTCSPINRIRESEPSDWHTLLGVETVLYQSYCVPSVCLFPYICFVLCDSSHAVNFFLYILSGARFRQHFLDLVRCRIRRRLHSQSSQMMEDRSYSNLQRQITLRTYV